MMHGVLETGLFMLWAIMVIGLIVFKGNGKQKNQ